MIWHKTPPAQNPVAILRKMIHIATNEGDIVFAPFMGVGSTGVAALSMGRRFETAAKASKEGSR